MSRVIFPQENRSNTAARTGEEEIREGGRGGGTFVPSHKIALKQFVSTKRHNFSGDSATVFSTVLNDAYREDDRVTRTCINAVGKNSAAI